METMKSSELKLYENEAEFEQAFAKLCEYRNIDYIKITDPVGAKKRQNKRPFDGLLSTEFGLIALEFKYGNGQLKPHQWKVLQEITEKNGSAFVLRYKWTKRKGSVFTIEVVLDYGNLWVYSIYGELDALLSGVVELKQLAFRCCGIETARN